MNNEDAKKMALFRFSLIAPLVNDTYDALSKSQYFKNIASKTHELPNGKKIQLSSSTIKKWYLLYMNNGFDSLIPKTRMFFARGNSSLLQIFFLTP